MFRRDEIRNAADAPDIDAAIGPLMIRAGITDGDIAAAVFSGFDWTEALPAEREQMIDRWLETEAMYGNA